MEFSIGRSQFFIRRIKMKTFILRNKRLLIGCLSILLAVLSMLCFLPKNVAKASADTTSASVIDCAENITFIGFNKQSTEENGLQICANYYIPDEYYLSENSYGVLICPQSVLEKNGITGNWKEESAANGDVMVNIVATTTYNVEGGHLVRFSLSNIPEAGADMLVFFINYVENNETSEIAYGVGANASYNGLSIDNQTVDLSDYVTQNEYNNLRNQANEKIAEKDAIIAELEASLGESGVDMSNFKTVAEYNQMKAELEARIAELEESQDAEQETEQPKEGMSVKQILGISLGAVLLIAIIVVVVAVKNKKKGDYE